MNKSTLEIAMDFAMRISKYTFKENMIDDFISFEDHVTEVLVKVIDSISPYQPTIWSGQNTSDDVSDKEKHVLDDIMSILGVTNEELIGRLNQKDLANAIKPEDKI